MKLITIPPTTTTNTEPQPTALLSNSRKYLSINSNVVSVEDVVITTSSSLSSNYSAINKLISGIAVFIDDAPIVSTAVYTRVY